jgi:hypothetical protein
MKTIKGIIEDKRKKYRFNKVIRMHEKRIAQEQKQFEEGLRDWRENIF